MIPNSTINIIKKIAKQRSHYVFAYYTPEDIFQEIFIMCIEALPRYNSSKGSLENFLSSHVARRLKNLRRDKYFRPGVDIVSSGYAWDKINLVNALPLDYSGTDDLEADDFVDIIGLRDELNTIRNSFPFEIQETFDDYLTNNEIPTSKLNEIKKFLDNDYE